jgi:hypothetical protein
MVMSYEDDRHGMVDHDVLHFYAGHFGIPPDFRLGIFFYTATYADSFVTLSFPIMLIILGPGEDRDAFLFLSLIGRLFTENALVCFFALLVIWSAYYVAHIHPSRLR